VVRLGVGLVLWVTTTPFLYYVVKATAGGAR
jgi:hypothetical protein